MESWKVCRICKIKKRAKHFRMYRKSCRKCCYLLGKEKVILWKNGRKEYVNSLYSAWRAKHPLSRKLSTLREQGVMIKGLLPILEKLYRQSPFCFYCGIALNVNEVSLDHKIPVSRGGLPDNPSNWAICCKDCNYLKGARTSEEFISFVKEYCKRFSVNIERSVEIQTCDGQT